MSWLVVTKDSKSGVALYATVTTVDWLAGYDVRDVEVPAWTTNILDAHRFDDDRSAKMARLAYEGSDASRVTRVVEYPELTTARERLIELAQRIARMPKLHAPRGVEFTVSIEMSLATWREFQAAIAPFDDCVFNAPRPATPAAPDDADLDVQALEACAVEVERLPT